jgi:hypothetical protein
MITNAWKSAPSLPDGDMSSEEGWVKLPDGSMLDYQISTRTVVKQASRLVLGATDAQDYWAFAGYLPVVLDSNGGNSKIVPEIGPGTLLPSGQVFWIGASGHTALYTPPSASSGIGSWAQGPDILDNNNNLLGGFDTPAAVEPNGKVLFAAGPIDGNEFKPITTIFEYDPTANTITQVTASGPNLNHKFDYSRMLVLPTGQILFSNSFDDNLYVYNPDGAPSPSWAPTISGISRAVGDTFTLRGTQLNGLDEGAAYGDDAQMATNYPIVRLTAADGRVAYAKSFYWSSTGVATGSTPESTSFTMPQVAPGIYNLTVVANGIESKPVVLVVGSSGDDTVTLDATNEFGIPYVSATLDGTTRSYTAFAISGIYVLPQGGSNTVNIERTVRVVPYTVDLAGGSTAVNVSPTANSLSNIEGDVIVTGEDGDDGLYLYDGNDANTDTYVIDPRSVTRAGAATIWHSSSDKVQLVGTSGGARYEVAGNGYGASTTLIGGQGDDTFDIDPTYMDLYDIQGSLTIVGAAGHDTLNLNDQNDPGDGTYSVTSSTISRVGAGTVTYSSVESVNLYGGPGNGTYNIEGTPTGTFLSVQGGSGNETFNISPAAQNLDNIQGMVSVNGGSGQDTANVYDGRNARPVTYGVDTDTFTYSSSIVTRTGAAAVSFDSNVEGLNLYGGGGDDLYDIEGTASRTPVAIRGGVGNDSFNVSPTAGDLGRIASALTISGGTGSDSLSLFDEDHAGAATYTVASSGVNRAGAAPIRYAAMAGVSLDGGTGDDTYNIESTAAGTPVNIAAGAGTNTFNVSPTARNLATIQGSVDLHGVYDSNALVLDDQANSTNARYSLVGPTVSRTGTATISYDTINRLVLNGGGGSDAYSINGTAAGIKLALVAGKGNDMFSMIATDPSSTASISGGGGSNTLVGPNVVSTWSINGPGAGSVGNVTFTAIRNLTGGSANDTFRFASGGSVAGKIDGGKGTNTLDYSGDGRVAATVNLAAAVATRTGGFANIQRLVGSTSSADKLVGPNATNNWSITAVNAGTVGSFSFTGVENLTGGTGLDAFVFGAGKSVSGKIDGGGGGNDWLDYAAYATPVTVNLAANAATGVGGGIANIRNVRGGQDGNMLTGNAQGNTLIGGAGTNVIVGGTGRSLLIGGKGKDAIIGHSGGDILIAGYTDYDSSTLAHDLALDAILAEWQSSNSYATRIGHIKNGGGLNGSNKFVWGITVHDNAASNANTLTGGVGAQNWFFANVSHTRTNKKLGERLN